MQDNAKLIETLFERTVEYGKTSFELVKLQALDKTSDVVSSFVPHSVVFVLIASFMLFFNVGLAFWLGELLGKALIPDIHPGQTLILILHDLRDVSSQIIFHLDTLVDPLSALSGE